MKSARLVDGINAVVSAAGRRIAPVAFEKQQVPAPVSPELLRSIEAVCSIRQSWVGAPTDSVAGPQALRMVNVSGIKDVTLAVLHAWPALELPRRPSILRMIDRAYNENLHSDFLAALLKDEQLGAFAHALFEALFSGALPGDCPPGGRATIKVRRESRLDSFDPRLTIENGGAARLDIFAQRDRDILIIENKVFTGERENQTIDYLAAIRTAFPQEAGFQIGCVLLSPGGMGALSPHFKPLSYLRLFDLLSSLKALATADGSQLLTFYCQELYETFINSRAIVQSRVKTFWEETSNVV